MRASICVGALAWTTIAGAARAEHPLGVHDDGVELTPMNEHQLLSGLPTIDAAGYGWWGYYCTPIADSLGEPDPPRFAEMWQGGFTQPAVNLSGVHGEHGVYAQVRINSGAIGDPISLEVRGWRARCAELWNAQGSTESVTEDVFGGWVPLARVDGSDLRSFNALSANAQIASAHCVGVDEDTRYQVEDMTAYLDLLRGLRTSAWGNAGGELCFHGRLGIYCGGADGFSLRTTAGELLHGLRLDGRQVWDQLEGSPAAGLPPATGDLHFCPQDIQSVLPLSPERGGGYLVRVRYQVHIGRDITRIRQSSLVLHLAEDFSVQGEPLLQGWLSFGAGLGYDPAHHALVTPVRFIEASGETRLYPGDGGNFSLPINFHGWRGVGLGFFPLERRHEMGVLSLDGLMMRDQVPVSDVVERRGGAPVPMTYPEWDLAIGPEGTILIEGWQTSFAPLGTIAINRAYRLRFDPLKVDLDRDGLTAAEEAALGTSDLSHDSDGDGLSDRVEVRLTHTSPTTFDETASLVGATADLSDGEDAVGTRHWVPSGWATWHPDHDLFQASSPPYTNAGDDQLLCAPGVCRHRSGATLAQWTPRVPGGAVALDASAVFELDDAGLWRIPLPHAERWRDGPAGAVGTPESGEPWVSAAEMEDVLSEGGFVTTGSPPFIAHSGSWLFPVSADRVFLWSWVWQRAILFETGRPPRRVFDVHEESCRLDPDGCEDGYWARASTPNGSLPQGFVAANGLGIHRATGGLMIEVSGTRDVFVALLLPDGDDLRLENLSSARDRFDGWQMRAFDAGTPASPRVPLLAPLPDGGYIGQADSYDAWLAPHRRPAVHRVLRSELHDNCRAGFVYDGMLLCPHTDPTVAYVPVRPVVEPGDVLVLTNLYPSLSAGLGGGHMLYRLGPRGGLVALWSSTYDELASVAGFAVLASGEGCVVDGLSRRVMWLEPDSDRVPLPSARTLEADLASGAIDCRMADPDAVDVLIGGAAPKVLRWTPSTGATQVVRDLSDVAARVPLHFLEGAPDAQVIFADEIPTASDGSLGGIGWFAGERRAFTMRRPHNPNDILDVAIRPDGIAVVSPLSHVIREAPVAIHPDHGEALPLTLESWVWPRGGGAAALALVPGGHAHDPFDGRERQASPGGEFTWPTPTHPQGGEPVAAPPPSEGCATGAVPFESLLIALWFIGAWRARTRYGSSSHSQVGCTTIPAAASRRAMRVAVSRSSTSSRRSASGYTRPAAASARSSRSKVLSVLGSAHTCTSSAPPAGWRARKSTSNPSSVLT